MQINYETYLQVVSVTGVETITHYYPGHYTCGISYISSQFSSLVLLQSG